MSWGSTYGSVAAAVSSLQEAGRARCDHLHLRYLNPFPANLGEVLKPYRRILVPENNMGQLCTLLRAKYLVDARPLSKVEGRPFRVSELIEQIGDFLRRNRHEHRRYRRTPPPRVAPRNWPIRIP